MNKNPQNKPDRKQNGEVNHDMSDSTVSNKSQMTPDQAAALLAIATRISDGLLPKNQGSQQPSIQPEPTQETTSQ